jgi:hypothetical protein
MEEFFKYFENVSATIDDDEYFEKIIQKTWFHNSIPRPFKVFYF